MALACGVAFGAAQGIMPLIGFFLGYSFSNLVGQVAPLLAFMLLGFIGLRTIYNAIKARRSEEKFDVRPFSLKLLIAQALATSIDAMAVGVGLGAMRQDIVSTVLTIAVIAFICSFIGVFIGNRSSALLKDKAEIAGGTILVLIGIRIFLRV